MDKKEREGLDAEKYRLWKSGKSARQIAEMFETSEKAVLVAIRRYQKKIGAQKEV
jgi:DNA-binding CsgD family transcriptional regulator